MTASATPAIKAAPMFPSGISLPLVSVGTDCRVMSNVRKRIPDLEALEAQKSPAPV